MYIGAQSPTHLDSFLLGFSWATKSNDNDVDLFNRIDFGNWVAEKFNYLESTSGWANMIEDQCDDGKEALWLFFELLDEYRGTEHEIIHTLDYSSKYNVPDINFYFRLHRENGLLKTTTKPRPYKIIIRKMSIDGEWYSIVALDQSGKVLDVRNSDTLPTIYKFGQEIYNIDKSDW